MGPLRINEKIPTGWTAIDQLGNTVSIDSIVGQRNLVIFFIPAVKTTAKYLMTNSDVEKPGKLYSSNSAVTDISTYDQRHKAGMHLVNLYASQYKKFRSLGAEVICVCLDSPQNIQAWTQKQRVPFAVLADPEWKLARAFKVNPAFAWWPKKVTYVVDRDGLVKMVHDSSSYDYDKTYDEHVVRAGEVLEKLGGGGGYSYSYAPREASHGGIFSFF
eukprot:tig00000037_g10093.t1